MHEPVLLGDLARVTKLHPTYFSDRFRQLVGVRPLEYLMQRRIERAQYLLLTSPASVKQIADEVGIADAAYFIRRSPTTVAARHLLIAQRIRVEKLSVRVKPVLFPCF